MIKLAFFLLDWKPHIPSLYRLDPYELCHSKLPLADPMEVSMLAIAVGVFFGGLGGHSYRYLQISTDGFLMFSLSLRLTDANRNGT